jgi:hypothetical protein
MCTRPTLIHYNIFGELMEDGHSIKLADNNYIQWKTATRPNSQNSKCMMLQVWQNVGPNALTVTKIRRHNARHIDQRHWF